MTYLFDFDGTLVDSVPAFSRKIHAMFDDFAVTPPEHIVEIITPLGNRGAAQYMIGCGLPLTADELLVRMDNYALEDYKTRIPAKFGVPEALRALKDAGHSLNVLSASPRVMIEVCLDRLGLVPLFDHVWSCDDFPFTKADSRIYPEAASRLGVPVSELIFADDNLRAVKAAKAAGCVTFGVYDPSSAADESAIRSVCDGYVYDLCELVPMPVTNLASGSSNSGAS